MNKRIFLTAILVLTMSTGTFATATEMAEPIKPLEKLELTIEQQREARQITRAYTERIRPIKEELWAKKTILRALTNNPNAQVRDIKKIVNAMKDLRARLHAERVVFEKGMVQRFGFIPTKHWIDKNEDAFRTADTDSSADAQKTSDSDQKKKSFFSRLFN